MTEPNEADNQSAINQRAQLTSDEDDDDLNLSSESIKNSTEQQKQDLIQKCIEKIQQNVIVTPNVVNTPT